MAWTRRGKPTKKHPQGLWRATVYTPAGRRTESNELKGVVVAWANSLETDIARHEFVDPHAATMTFGALWAKCQAARRVEKATRRRDESQWRNHVAPRWAKVQLNEGTKIDVMAWTNDMEERGVGAASIAGALNVLRVMCDMAVDEGWMRTNITRGVAAPRGPGHVDRVLLPDEEASILARLDQVWPGRPDARLFVETLFDTGIRWEECAALNRDLVDMRRARLGIRDVMEADGMIRPYPKTEAGERPVPVSDHLWPRLRDHILTRPPGSVVFTALQGGRLWYSQWWRDVWSRGITIEVPDELKIRSHTARGRRPGRPPKTERRLPYLPDPQPTPHDCRHTYGTRLADNGVPPHEIAALLGHKSLRSVERYLHAGEERFARARQALEAARTAPTKVDHSPATHDLNSARVKRHRKA